MPGDGAAVLEQPLPVSPAVSLAGGAGSSGLATVAVESVALATDRDVLEDLQEENDIY